MADEKTILRELSAIVGIGLARAGNKMNKLNPDLFLSMAKDFCGNIQGHNVELYSCSPSINTILFSIKGAYSCASFEKLDVVINIPFFALCPCNAPANF